MEEQREFKFTREDFDYLRKIVTESTGIIANEDKYTMYYSRLARRVRQLGLADFGEYRKYLSSNPDTELMELVNSVTTNLTSFFRENHHFEFLKTSFVPLIPLNLSARILKDFHAKKRRIIHHVPLFIQPHPD